MLDSDDAGFDQLFNELQNVRAKPGFIHVEFLLHLLTNPLQSSVLEQVLPDPCSHIVEAEIAFALEIQEHRFTIQLLHQYLR